MAYPMPVLNNIALFTLYIICFFSIFNTNTETIGFYLLFVVNTITSFYILQNDIFVLKNTNFVVLLSLFSIIFYFTVQSVSLLFIIVTISALNAKFSKEKKAPVRYSDKYKKYLDDFKIFTIVSFSFSFVLFMANYTMGMGILNTKITELKNDYKTATLLTIVTLISVGLIGLTSYNLYITTLFSKLRNKELL